MDIRPVARDAFVFIKNATNPVDNITTDQIRQVYTGGLTHWNALGGPEEAILPLGRERNSGSEELMRELVMKDLEPMEVGALIVGGGMSFPFNQLSQNPWGIGYTVYYYQQRISLAPRIELLAVDGVLPTPETIASGEYPYVTEVYAVIRADEPADSEARELRDWLLTEEGQEVVAETGYVPVGTEQQ